MNNEDYLPPHNVELGPDEEVTVFLEPDETVRILLPEGWTVQDAERMGRDLLIDGEAGPQ